MAIRSLAFAPNGRWLATASHDQTVKLLEAATSSERILLRDAAQVHFESASEYADRNFPASAPFEDHLSALEADTVIDPALRNSIRNLILARSLGAERER